MAEDGVEEARMYQIDKIQYLQIGVQGENVAQTIDIDMSTWAEEFPDATFHVIFKPYNATAPSPMLTTYEAPVLHWTVTLGATAVAGVGYTEVRAKDAETGLIKKSKIIPTAVENSVSGVETEPPASYQEWVDAVLNSAAAVLAAAHGKQVKFEIKTETGHLMLCYSNDETVTVDTEWTEVDLGPVDAYAIAVLKGYEGTADEFAQYMANIANGSSAAAASATAAAASAAEAAQYTSDAVATWLDNKFGQISADPPLDRTLSQALAAAPADMVGDLKSAIHETAFDILSIYGTFNARTHQGIVFTPIQNGFNVNRTSTGTATAVDNIYDKNNTLPDGIIPGSKVFLEYNSTTTDIVVGVCFYDSNGAIIGGDITRYTDNAEIDVPADAVGLTLRVQISKSSSPSNATITIRLYPSIYNNFPYQEIKKTIETNVNMRAIATTPSCDLNDLLDDCFVLLDQENTYLHRPDGTEGQAAFFSTSHVLRSYLQIYIPFSPTEILMRRKLGNNSFTSWKLINGGDKYINNYTFNEYSNEYTVTATPVITADANNYLQSTGDNTDVTQSIVTMLSQTGICNLGPGKFFVSGIDMPDNSMIRGSGSKTELILIGTGDGYAIKPGDYCIVENLAISGKETGNITLSATLGGRHGILWQGNYTENPHQFDQPLNGKFTNLYIHGFTGGGITCYDTGLGTNNMVNMSNVDIWNCNAGINIAYYSEFNKFTAVKSAKNYYGCINNGGNNTFANCDFSNNVVGFLMDNSTGQSPNNSHGTCACCVFNHSDSNNGIGIKVLNCEAGFIFTGCQVYFSQIYIVDSDGIVVSDSNFGGTDCDITISGGGVVLFANNVHKSAPTKTITNNTNVHFSNCYVRDTGAIIS